MREWFLSTELVGLRGMANSSSGVAQKARRNNWLTRRSKAGTRALEYHISNFHPDIKKQLIEKYVTDPKEAEKLMNLPMPESENHQRLAFGELNLDELERQVDDGTFEEPNNSISSRRLIESLLHTGGFIDPVIKEQIERILEKLTAHAAKNASSNVSKVVPLTEVKEWCELPVFDVHAAAGAGSLVHSEYQIEQLIIPTSLLAEFGLSPANASIIYVDGNSMEPTLSHKDRLLVDTRELQHPVTDGVYVIRIDDAVYVKRLKWNIPKGIYNVVSDNPEHESFEINHNNGRNFKIIGKAVAPVFKRIF